MIRIILLASLFFLGEIYLLEKSLNNLYKKDLWKINFKNDSQRRIFKIMQAIDQEEKPSIFLFGGSASREFFAPDTNVSQQLGISFYNCAVSSESIYDSLKLQTLVKSNNIIVYGIHPKSLYDHSFDTKQIIQGYYFGGAYYKYPLYSKYLNHILPVEDNNISILNQFAPILNSYIYLTKEYIKNHSISEIISNPLNNKIPKQYYYLTGPMSQKKLMKKLDNYFQKSKPYMGKNLKLNFSLLEKMVQLANEKNNKFILFELPFSPLVQRHFKPYFPAYYQALNHLLKKYPNIIYISNHSFPNTKQRLFFDTIHLLPEGRNYYYDTTIKSLKKVIHQ